MFLYTISKSKTKKNTALIFVELLAVSSVPCIWRHPIYLIHMYKQGIPWYNLQRLICSKTHNQPTNQHISTGYDRNIGPAVRVFANGPGDLGSIPGRVIPKTLKMELDTTLLNTQHYKVRFKGKVEQSREWSSALPYTLV